MNNDDEFEQWARDPNNQQAEDWQIFRAGWLARQKKDAEICANMPAFTNGIQCAAAIREAE